MTQTLRAALLAATALLGAKAAQATTLVALTADNQLLRIDSQTRRAMAPARITGADGQVVGIDQRPQDGRLYGVTDRGQIVTIDPANGRATQVSRLNVPFQPGGRAVVDFNPVANRLRVMAMDGQNLRVNVETGEAVQDGRLKNAPGALGEVMPRVIAGAYTNSMQGATATMLLTIDAAQNALNVQNPPNDGVQAPRARLSVPLPGGTAAFDILAEGNQGILIADGALHMLNLESGAIATRGAITGLPRGGQVIDVAVMR